ncbi:hypothetical protein D3273_13335 [Lichenibacterium minor]|uniref:Uncharacterized protein n=1 Tax=Lichenibacterium minor TaxID=2316528 RepID=A0A4Q2U8G9_9HYPH|nr:hypothetical protein [Lichenibacterium minor]RYC31367.1 hypothetical protein D3273_13335 [Lichenibacterium minor]
MQKREGRSFAPPPSSPPRPDLGRTGRKRWTRPDMPRPAVPVRVLLPTLDTALPDVEPPEPLTALDHLALLPREARQDIVRGAL